MSRHVTIAFLALFLFSLSSSGQNVTKLPDPPSQHRPAWWREEGVVIAGAWEPLLARVRGGGTQDYDHTMQAWRREHSEEIARKLKELGFNLIIIPLYKGASLKDEREGMEDAKRMTEICHRLGLHVGCYTFSGTIFYESMLAETPDASNWLIKDQNGQYIHYSASYYRRWANRSHPGLRAHMRKVVRYAVEEAKVDLIHFDNYMIAPGYEPYSVQQFQEYLKKAYSPEERMRRFGFSIMDFIEPPPPPPGPDRYNVEPLYQDFVDYRCETQADTYRELAEYARSLNPEILIECNPHGYYGKLNTYGIPIGSIDHTRLIQWGGAFWDEDWASRLENGIMIARFRSHKLGRQFNNMVFQYTPGPVSMAESMANNLQCLGNPVWFGGGDIIPTGMLGGPRELEPSALAYIRFFHQQQRYFRDTEEIADIGVLNTYANTAYGPQLTRDRLAAFEQALYQGKLPFTLVPGRYPGDLKRFRVLALADIALISDTLVGAVRNYVRAGGGLVITGQATQFDEHNHRRDHTGLADLFAEPLGDKVLHAQPGTGRAVYLPRIVIPDKFKSGMLPENRGDILDAVRWAAGGPLQADVKAPETVTMSLYRQPGGRQLLHLVNYDDKHPVSNIAVSLRVPASKRIASVTLLSPDPGVAQNIPCRQEAQQLRFTVPKLTVYDLVVVE